MKMSKIFHVQPPSSALYPSDKAQAVSITFRSDKELEFKDLPVLKCQVCEVKLHVYLMLSYHANNNFLVVTSIDKYSLIFSES